MLFLLYSMGDDSEPMPPPTPELMAEMGEFIEETTQSGVLIATGGLAPSATETRIKQSNGKVTVTDGPFAETRELIGGFALIRAASKEEAIEYAKRFLRITGDGETHIRQVFGSEDA